MDEETAIRPQHEDNAPDGKRGPARSVSNARERIREILPIYKVKLVRNGRCKTVPAAVQSSRALHELMRPYFAGLDREHIMALYLDAGLHPIGCKLESIGSASQCLADIRLIVRDALLANASSLALSHNHPSGDPQPSPEDRALTARVSDALTAVGIRLIDHIIIGLPPGYFSFADQGFFHRNLHLP
jgi:DNA repair protein RadC